LHGGTAEDPFNTTSFREILSSKIKTANLLDSNKIHLLGNKYAPRFTLKFNVKC
jgi:hypothetical protein